MGKNLIAANLVAGEEKKEEKKIEDPKKDIPAFQPRKNFNETAFFFPQLYADSSGNYTFSITIPEEIGRAHV